MRSVFGNADVANKIELKLAPAAETYEALIEQGEAGTFDFAFIDTDKPIIVYYEKSLELLRAAAVAIDNVLWAGK